MKRIYIFIGLLIFCTALFAQTKPVKRTTYTTKTQKKKPPSIRKEVNDLKKEVKALKVANEQLKAQINEGSGKDILDQLFYQMGEIDSSLFSMQATTSEEKMELDSLISKKFKSNLTGLINANYRIDELIKNNEKISKIIVVLGITILGIIIGSLIFFLILKYRYDRKNRIIIRYLKRLRTDMNKHIETRFQAHR